MLPHIGIDVNDIPKADPLKIKDSEEAYTILLNVLKASTEHLNENKLIISNLEEEIHHLEIKATERRSAVIIMTVGEIVTSIGVAGIFSNYIIISCFIVLAGMFMTALSLYLNFKQ